MKTFLFIVLLFIISLYPYEPSFSQMTEADKIRIREAIHIAQNVGDSLWDNWNKVPFAILMITDSTEYLINHPQPSNDFILLGYDSLIEASIYSRQRLFPPNLLATFPAVNGISTVVIGQPHNTEANTSPRWVLTLLHEHFHQLQTSQPDYYEDVAKLDLAKGDNSGMWMLNYPFPYQSVEIQLHFDSLLRALHRSLISINSADFNHSVEQYLLVRRRLKEALSEDDYKYFSFQLWQEGVARYTEYAVAKFANDNHKPSPEYQALPDFAPLNQEAAKFIENLLVKLPNIQLNEYQRVIFYYIGSAEALLLDHINNNWKKLYFKQKFYLEDYFSME
jgi:hypothetical protein